MFSESYPLVIFKISFLLTFMMNFGLQATQMGAVQEEGWVVALKSQRHSYTRPLIGVE